MRIELEMLKTAGPLVDDEVVDELRERIKTLNSEKMELLNSLQANKTEVTNLRTQINYYLGREKETGLGKQGEEEILRAQIIKLQSEAQCDADSSAAAIRQKDGEITRLKLEIDNLNVELRKLKEQLQSRDALSPHVSSTLPSPAYHRSSAYPSCASRCVRSARRHHQSPSYAQSCTHLSLNVSTLTLALAAAAVHAVTTA